MTRSDTEALNLIERYRWQISWASGGCIIYTDSGPTKVAPKLRDAVSAAAAKGDMQMTRKELLEMWLEALVDVINNPDKPDPDRYRDDPDKRQSYEAAYELARFWETIPGR